MNQQERSIGSGPGKERLRRKEWEDRLRPGW